MLTVTFKSVLEGVLKRAGIVPPGTDADALAVIDFIADRYRTAQEYYRWPVYTLIEQRWFREIFDEAATYAEDDEIYYPPLDAYYVALAATGAGEDPQDTPAKWQLLENFNHEVEYEPADQTPIAAVIGAYDKDPRAFKDALALPYQLRQTGVGFAPDVKATSVWLEFRPRAEDFSAGLWNNTDVFHAGTILYYDVTGEVYTVLVTTTVADTPDGAAAAKFELVPFPEFLARAVKAGALADWFATDEKPENSDKWEGKFEELLDEQVFQIVKVQGQTGRPTVQPKS